MGEVLRRVELFLNGGVTGTGSSPSRVYVTLHVTFVKVSTTEELGPMDIDSWEPTCILPYSVSEALHRNFIFLFIRPAFSFSDGMTCLVVDLATLYGH